MLATPRHIPCVFFVSHEAINTYWLSLRALCHQNRTDWFLEHHAIKTAHLAYSNFTDSQLLKSRTACMIHVLQYNFWLCPPLSFFHVYSLSTLSALHQRQASSSSNTSNSATKLMAFTLSQALVPMSGTVSPKTSGTLLLYLPSKTNSKTFSSPNILIKQHCPSPLSICTMCVCMFHIVT